MCPTAEEQQDWDVGFASAPVARKDRKAPTLSPSCGAGETDSQPPPAMQKSRLWLHTERAGGGWHRRRQGKNGSECCLALGWETGV